MLSSKLNLKDRSDYERLRQDLLHKDRWGTFDYSFISNLNLKKLFQEFGDLCHLALDLERVGAFEQFVNHGADVSVKDREGRSLFERVLIAKIKSEWVFEKLTNSSHCGELYLTDYIRKQKFRYLIDIINELKNHRSNNQDNIQFKPKNGSGYLHIELAFMTADITLLRNVINRIGNNREAKKIYGNLLHLTLHTGNIEFFWELINAGAEVAVRDGNGNSLLHKALDLRNEELCLALIKAAKDTKCFAVKGKSLLIKAYFAGFKDICIELIKFGENVNTVDEYGNNLLQYALINNGVDFDRSLIELGANVNVKYGNGDTLLHWALKNNKLKIAQVLIENGADINAPDGHGDAPLHWASKTGKLKTARFLIENGADVNALDKNRDTPLHSVVRGNYLQICRELIKAGAKVNFNSREAKPLYLAVEVGNLQICRELINAGADLNALNSNMKHTALHLAVEKNNLLICQELIKAGADVNVRDVNFETPLALLSMDLFHVEIIDSYGEYRPFYNFNPDDIDKHYCRERKKKVRDLDPTCFRIGRLLIESGAELNANVSRFQGSNDPKARNLYSNFLDRGFKYRLPRLVSFYILSGVKFVESNVIYSRLGVIQYLRYVRSVVRIEESKEYRSERNKCVFAASVMQNANFNYMTLFRKHTNPDYSEAELDNMKDNHDLDLKFLEKFEDIVIGSYQKFHAKAFIASTKDYFAERIGANYAIAKIFSHCDSFIPLNNLVLNRHAANVMLGHLGWYRLKGRIIIDSEDKKREIRELSKTKGKAFSESTSFCFSEKLDYMVSARIFFYCDSTPLNHLVLNRRAAKAIFEDLTWEMTVNRVRKLEASFEKPKSHMCNML